MRSTVGTSSRLGVMIVAAMLCAAGLAFCGCAGDARPIRTEAELYEMQSADEELAATEFAAAVERCVVRVGAEGAGLDGPVCDVLALSGGGDFGAFGSGFLLGWGETPEATDRRPDFDGVSGVSTGSLIAPFAFLGDEGSLQQIDQFYRNPRQDWIKTRGWFFFLPMFPSFMEIPGLDRDIRGAIDEAFIRRIAARASEGRVLLVSATNLDLGTQRAWDLGGYATRMQTPSDIDRIHRMMFASSAIPAVFPPIEIDGFLYADGGVTANVLLRLDPSSPTGFPQTWQRIHPGRPMPRIRYWIIVNNQLRQPPATVRTRWPSIFGPSLATAIRSATVAEIRWLAAQADYTNAAFGTNIEVRSVAIPDDWRPPVKGDFQKPTMDSLSDLGREMGKDPRSWTLWTRPLAATHSSGVEAREAVGQEHASTGTGVSTSPSSSR